MILDGGACPLGLESTVVGFDAGDRPCLLRPGALAVEDLEAATFAFAERRMDRGIRTALRGVSVERLDDGGEDAEEGAA